MKTLNPGTRVEIKTGVFKGRQGVIQTSQLMEDVADEIYVHTVLVDDHSVPMKFTHNSLKVAKNNKEVVTSSSSTHNEQNLEPYRIINQVFPDEIAPLMYTLPAPS